MAKQENPIIEEQVSWMGWMSNDEYSWPANHFWDSKNVSIRKNSREVTLSDAITQSYYTVPWIPVAHYGAGTSQVTFCSNGYVGWTTWDCWATVAGNIWNIRNAIQYGYNLSYPNILMLSTTGISIRKYVWGSFSPAITLNQRTFNATTSNRPALIFKGWLLLWDGNKIVKITWDGSVYAPASWVLSLANIIFNLKNSDETILKMFELGDQVVIFTNRWQYFWDWFNLEYDRFVPRDEPIIDAAQYKTMFYVITKTYNLTTLWKTSTWYDRIPVQKDDANNTTNRLSYGTQYNNSMITAAGIVYFWWKDTSEILSYGAYNPWMWETLERHTYTNAMSSSTTSFYMWSDWLLYFGNYNGTDYNVWYISVGIWWYSTKEWIIRQTPILWWGRWQDKEMVKYRLWWILWTFGRFLLYARVDDETDKFTFYAESYSVAPSVWAIYTCNTNTYTIVATYNDSLWRIWITTQQTVWINWTTNTGTLTKATGTGDTSINYTSMTSARLVSLIDGSVSYLSGKYKFPWMLNIPFNKLQFGLWLKSFSTFITPKLNDFYREYNQINNDL